MSKFIRIYMSESDYELLSRVAKSAGKGISSFSRELLTNSIKRELRDTGLLQKLIQKIETLSEPQYQNQNQSMQLQSEILLQQIKHNTVAVIECLLALSNEFFFDKRKHENFVSSVRQILQKIE